LVTILLAASHRPGAATLTTLEFLIAGAELRVSPSVFSVPKNIAGSVLVEWSGGAESLPEGTFVEATLRGPSFPARRVIGQVNQALLLPPLPVVGDYQLDGIRLVRLEGTETVTIQESNPSSVPIRVFDEVLVSRVTSRPLSLDEIRERGIAIDDQNFRAVEFEVGFVLDGQTIPVRFPVVAPAFGGNTEIIPIAELQERLAQAEAINNSIDLGSVLPPELETARLNIEIKGINFQVTEESEQDLMLSIPPIPALLVIPGNIGFLNQFFSVQIFTENAAPTGSGLSVMNVQALLKLPTGPDQVVSTNYSQPGDDPLRFARIGPDKIIHPVQPVVRPGADGKTGTSDDIPRLQPGESGTGEFLVEGLQEGLHVMDLDLTADLEGLAAGIVRIKGKAAGSVLVRNPKFSLAFSHPRTVRAEEPYDLYVTVLNTSSSVANLVQVQMAAASISGGVLDSAETVVLGTIQPGQTATARFQITSKRTGSISFSNLTTSDDSVVGRFRLRGGFDERGVALSPDTIGMPDYVTNLPPALINAANRVLGQALSVATAGQLPSGVKSIGKSVVTRRVLELAEAGQRLQYGDTLPRVLSDILLDWQGGRDFSAGFDQIVRETDAGREWREALAGQLDLADGLDAVARLGNRLPDLAGRGEAWAVLALNSEGGSIRFSNGAFPPVVGLTNEAGGAPRYDHTNALSGVWLVERSGTNLVFEWRPDAAVPAAELVLALVETNGTARQLRWNVSGLPTGACVRYDASDPAHRLLIDHNCDGQSETTLAASVSTTNELPPAMISVRQDPSVHAGRPPKICSSVVGFPLNYGTVLAVLFSKPMTQEKVSVPSAFSLENGNTAGSVQIQPGGRVALLNMRQPVGGLRERTLTVSGVTDPRGQGISSNALRVISNLREGAAVRGRVARADGSPAAGIPVTLTYYDRLSTGLGCDDYIVRPGQVFTDDAGYFDFDFVVSGIPYSISATDTLGLSPEAIATILESTRADEFQRARLLELASSPGVQNTLLADFAVGALADVVARAEGLDRALLRDFIGPGSGREGSEVPVALRFRGRGAVAGRVVSADGVTPVPRVAVNLFPDPASRELGRGLFSDGDGRFAFLGVPLGVFSIEANSGFGLSRTVAGVIERPGQVSEVLVVLSSAEVLRTDLTGRVTENDNVTPHAGATVYVGNVDSQGRFCCVVAAPTTDADGYWRATGIPADTYVLKAVSLDGKRQGERINVPASAGLANFASIALQGYGVVIGRVVTANEIPVINAIVAGGEQLVRTTNNGTFRLTGVPTGFRTISAGAERSVAGSPPKSTPAFSFPRLGSASVNVLPGVENFVVVRFDPKGSLIGRVVDETGSNAVTGISVALPEQNGFQWVPVNGRGEFAFEGIALRKYTVSAPAPPVLDADVSGILDTLGDSESTEGELQAAIGEAFAIFTGAADPLLNGEGAAFNPSRWGYVEAELKADGEVRNVTVQFFRSSTIAGTVLNGQSFPIGARVRLTGVGPAPNGGPMTLIRGEMNSDPALGTFRFERAAFIGSYGLQAASPFFPIVLVQPGFTSEVEPDDTDVVLQFPAARDINGRLTGQVFNPDGSPVAAGVKVRIRGRDFEVTTATNGVFFFGNQFNLPAIDREGRPGVGYFVEAEDLVNATVGAASVIVLPGETNQVSIRLLGRGALHVTVLQNNGAPAVGARLGYDQGNYPSEVLLLANGPVTDANGQALFQNLFEGYYGVSARFISGPTSLNGRVGASVAAGRTNDVVIRLGPTGTIEGHFVKRDGTTPIASAQVAVGASGFATTDTNGFFRVTDVPLGTYRLTSSDPVSGVGAILNATLTFDQQILTVRLVEQARGEILGAVIASDGVNLAPGVNVTLTVSDGITPPRTVTSGPDGRFSFPGTPAGPFILNVEHPITKVRGSGSATLPENAATFEINVPLDPLAAVTIAVRRPGGVQPATNVTVKFGGVSADTDSSGRVTFSDQPLGEYVVTATSRILAETHSVVRTNLLLQAPGTAPEVLMVLSGVGRVSGQVRLSDGVTPAAGATVVLAHEGAIVRDSLTTGTDSNGQFVIPNVAVGPYQIAASFGALGVRASGSIVVDGESDVVNLTLAPSASVAGQLVRADGATPVSSEDVVLSRPGSGTAGALFRTGTNGLFGFSSVPLGPFRLESIALGFNGIALFDGVLNTNGETNNVGQLVMDEDDPRVVTVTPADTAVGVPITTPVELVFNEALRTNTVDSTGVYLQGPSNTVAASVQLLNDTNGVPRAVRLIPTTPLRSLTTYRVVVVDGVRQDAFGNILGRGPQDRVGRPLVAPFLSTFTTADNDPPLLVSIFPTNGQIQIDPRAVMRLSFNEPIRETNFALTLIGPNGPVAGAASVGLNGLVLAFAPTAALGVNAGYTLTVSNVFDLAGNRATNEPFTATFATLDTMGPTIATLRIADGRVPVAGSTIEVEAVLATNEVGSSVRFTKDLTNAGSDTNAPFRAPITLPTSGSTTIRAIASDRFGNDGPLSELVINTVPNQPPTVSLVRVDPASGPVFRGEPFTVRVSASDDASVTNVAVTVTGIATLATNVPTGDVTDVTFMVPTNAAAGSALTVRARAADFAGVLSTEATLSLVVSNLNHRPVTLAGASGAGRALRFDGVDDFVAVASSPSVNPTTALTLEAWVFAENLNASQIGIAGTWDDNNGGFRTYLLWLLGGRLEFIVSSFARPSDSSTLPINRWVHVAATYDGATVRLYRDGTNISSVASSGPIASNNRPFLIGRTEGGSDGPDFFPGSIDEVRLWNRALSPAEIAEQRSLVLTGTEPGLLGYWQFNDATGDSTADLTTNSNIGLLGGGAAASQPARVVSTAPVTGVAIATNTSLALLPLKLDGSDPDGDPVTVMVTVLPAHGTLFQTTNGVTPGAAITNVPATVTHPGRVVIFRREPGYSGPDRFVYVLNDGLTNSADGVVLLELETPPGLDTDGDGMPDVYEFANGLNPEVNDAAFDADSDGLNNLGEFQAGTNPRIADTDGDGLPDGVDPDPLQPSGDPSPAVLTFNLAGIADFQDVDQGYGDRVTGSVMGNFSYGGTDPFTPNVTVSYGANDPALWTTGYGTLTNVLFEDTDNTGVLTVTLTADPGFRVNLHDFKLAAYTTAFSSDPSISRIEVTDSAGNAVFVSENQTVSRTSSSSLQFEPPLSGSSLTIRVDARNLGELNDDIAIDDIRFSQTTGSPGVGELAITTYAQVIDPIQLSFAPDGTLFVGRDNFGSTNDPAHWDDPVKIHRVGPGGAPVTEYGDAPLQDPDGVLFDALGSISGTPGSVLVAGGNSSFQGFIRAVRPDESIEVVFGPSSSFGNPQTLKFDRNGRLLFIEPNSGQHGVWASAGGPPALLVGLNLPIHLAVAENNTIYVSDQSQSLRSFTPGGAPLNNPLATGLSAFYFDVGPGGFFGTNIWGVDASGRLLEVNRVTGAVTERATGLGPACYFAVFGPDRALYISQFDQDRILRVAPVFCAPVPAGAIAWWKAESNALDRVSTQHGTLLNGATFTNGMSGGGFLLDGVNDHLTVAASPALAPQQFTLEGWIKTPGGSEANLEGFIVSRSGPSGFSGFDWSVSRPSNQGRLRLVINGGVSGADFLGARSVTDNQFHHVAATYDGSIMKLYVDGVLDAQKSVSVTPTFGSSDPLTIGRREFASIPGHFPGVIDELTIYDRALAPTEIASIFNASAAGKCLECVTAPANLAAWWPGNGDANDIIGGVPGSLQNGADFTANGLVGAAFNLDGVDDFVDIGPLAAIDDATEFSVAAWVNRLVDTADRRGGIVGKWDTGGASANTFLLYNGEGGLVDRGGFAIAFDDNSLASTAGTTVMARDQWYHLAVTWRSSDGQLVFYKNGIPEATGAAGAGRLLQTHRAFTAKIGEWGVVRDSQYKWPGLIDEVMVFNRALGASEIAAIAAAGSAGICPPVVSAMIPPVEFRLGTNLRLFAADQATGEPSRVVLDWSGRSGTTFAVEASLDLVHWFAVPVELREIVPGRYEGMLNLPVEERCFFRVLQLPP